MPNSESLYLELKPSISAIVTPLFELSEKFLHESGNFLPHAAILTEAGEVQLVAAYAGKDFANSTEILPLLHSGLRTEAAKKGIAAIGVAENVTIALEGQRATNAIKVLFEHKKGLAVAIYLPFEKKLLGGYKFGTTFSLAAYPEVNAWTNDAT